jgi:hypothetical protein
VVVGAARRDGRGRTGPEGHPIEGTEATAGAGTVEDAETDGLGGTEDETETDEGRSVLDATEPDTTGLAREDET